MKAHPLDLFLAAEDMRKAVSALCLSLSDEQMGVLEEPARAAFCAIVEADMLLIAALRLTTFVPSDLDRLLEVGRREELLASVESLGAGVSL